MRKIKMIVAGLAVATAALFGGLAISAQPVLAAGGACPDGSARAKYDKNPSECNLPKTDKEGTSLMGRVNIIINVALGLIGVFAVVMIIYGGFTYTTSQGDAAKVKKAKDTILYSVIGLIISLLAFAIVNFVLGSVFSSGTENAEGGAGNGTDDATSMVKIGDGDEG